MIPAGYRSAVSLLQNISENTPDAHHPKHLEPYYQDCCLVVDKLGLDEEQKFNPFASN